MSTDLLNGERLLTKAACYHNKSFFNMQSGTLYVTNYRFIFARPSKAARFLLGTSLIDSLGGLKGTEVAFEIPLKDIKGFFRQKKSSSYYLLKTTTSEYKFTMKVTPVSLDWLPIFKEAVSQSVSGTVVDSEFPLGGFIVQD